MTKVRTLSEDEIREIKEKRFAKERALHPKSRIDIRVKSKTDESGQPVVHVDILTEQEMPKNWKP